MAMSEHGLTEEEVGVIRDAFERFEADADSVVVFGSRAKGAHREGSDVDLAYRGRLRPEQRARIKDYLEEETLLPYMFDIVEYDTLENRALRGHIDRVGKPL